MAGRDIVCRRDHRGYAVVEGVRHAWVHHSPTCFEWGYSGSGPSDLALNILLESTGDRDFSWQHHHDFKWRFLDAMPREGATIAAADIEAWIAGRRARAAVEVGS